MPEDSQDYDRIKAVFEVLEKKTQPARPHPYIYAHHTLPMLLFREPLVFLGSLINKNGEEFLKALWDKVGEQLDVKDRLKNWGLRYFVKRIEKWYVFVIHLPDDSNLGCTEAYYIAAAIHIGEDETLNEKGDEHEKVTLRYFTLERSIKLDGSWCSVLGERTAEGKHLNHGNGPIPNDEDFVDSIKPLL